MVSTHVHVHRNSRNQKLKVWTSDIYFSSFLFLIKKKLIETLRLYPAFGIVTRECTKDYQISGSNVVIEKGTPIYISITGFQHDPNYYEQPDEFMPDRFQNNSVDAPFFTFGDGPRNCIGERRPHIVALKRIFPNSLPQMNNFLSSQA